MAWWPSVRGLLLLAAALGLVAALAPADAAPSPGFTSGVDFFVPWTGMNGTGLLSDLHVGEDFSCQAYMASDPMMGLYYASSAPLGDCGTFFATEDGIFGPLRGLISCCTNEHDLDLSHVLEATTVVRHGTGTALDPYVLIQSAPVGLHGLVLSQTWTWRSDAPFYWVNTTLTNTGATTQDFVFYQAADCYLAGHDQSFGATRRGGLDGPACTQYDGVDAGGAILLSPQTPGGHWQEATYNQIWEAVSTGASFNDTCICSEYRDNGVGVSWHLLLGPGLTWHGSLLVHYDPPTRIDVPPSLMHEGADFDAEEDQGMLLFEPVVAPDGDVEAATVTTPPTHGIVHLMDGLFGPSLTYIPDSDFCGSDGFDYEVTDGHAVVTGHADILVACVNDTPALAPLGALSVQEDADVAPFALLAIAGPANEAAQRLTFDAEVLDPEPGFPSGWHGFRSSPWIEDGLLRIDLAPDACGSTSVRVTVNDGGDDASTNHASRIFRVDVACVNDPPRLVAPDPLFLREANRHDTIEAWVEIDSFGPPDEAATQACDRIEVVRPFPAFLSFLEVSCSGDLEYRLMAGRCSDDGQVMLALWDSDGARSALVPMRLAVTCANDPPNAVVGDLQAYADQGETVTPHWIQQASRGDGDIAGLLAVRTDFEAGTWLALDVDGGVRADLTWLPDPDACMAGPRDQVATFYDDGEPPLERDVPYSFFIQRGHPDRYDLDEDTDIMIPAPGVLGNDAPGASTAVLVLRPAHGAFAFSADGAFTYRPDADYEGFDSFRYVHVMDGQPCDTVDVVIEVDAVDDAPTAVTQDVALVVDEEGRLRGRLRFDAHDADGELLRARLLEAPRDGLMEFDEDGSFVLRLEELTAPPTLLFSTTDGRSASAPMVARLVLPPGFVVQKAALAQPLAIVEQTDLPKEPAPRQPVATPEDAPAGQHESRVILERSPETVPERDVPTHAPSHVMPAWLMWTVGGLVLCALGFGAFAVLRRRA